MLLYEFVFLFSSIYKLKAAVRGMDTVTDAMYKLHPGSANVTKFIVGGKSKVILQCVPEKKGNPYSKLIF